MKNKAIKLFIVFFSIMTVILIVQSCAVSGMGSAPLTFRPQTSPNGLIFGSLTFPKEKPKFNGYFLKIAYKSDDPKTVKKNSTEIAFSPEQIIKLKHKGVVDNGLTYLFAIERPEGAYEISSIRLFTNSGIAVLQKNENLSGFSIPFNVIKGEITYVGNINFNEYGSKNQWAVTYKNAFEKDLSAIKKAQQYIYWDAAKNDSTRSILYR